MNSTYDLLIPDQQDQVLRGELARFTKMGYTAKRHSTAANEIERGPATLGPRRFKYQPTDRELKKIAEHRLAAAYYGGGVAMRSAVNRYGTKTLKKRLEKAGVNLSMSYRFDYDERNPNGS